MEELNRLPRIRDWVIVWVSPTTWFCPFCDIEPPQGNATSIDWLGETDSVDGRCRDCGAKFQLGRFWESIPTVFEQINRMTPPRGWQYQ